MTHVLGHPLVGTPLPIGLLDKTINRNPHGDRDISNQRNLNDALEDILVREYYDYHLNSLHLLRRAHHAENLIT